MDSASSSLLCNPSSLQSRQNLLPTQFIWPKEDLVNEASQELNEPLIDLAGLFRGDTRETLKAAELLHTACVNHGFFQVTNHGVEEWLVSAAHEEQNNLFKLRNEKKMSLKRKAGSIWGYSGAHSDRYSSKLPWKETFSFRYDHGNCSTHKMVHHYFTSVIGNEFEDAGIVYEWYCAAMEKLSEAIFELLAISLGVERKVFKKFFQDGSSIMRCNYYPRCNQPGLTLGTGPHTDPTALTILHQDQVGGLQVFASNKWQSVRPRAHAFVVNIGDTFKALTNGKYKSCMHRAVVNKEMERKSLVYFVCPREDKVVRAVEELVDKQGGTRIYPDFTWSDLFTFTQTHYRADNSTLVSFFSWLLPSPTAVNHPSASGRT
ncbi:hypothetical protein ACET3Z_010428 [Daucus carota]